MSETGSTPGPDASDRSSWAGGTLTAGLVAGVLYAVFTLVALPLLAIDGDTPHAAFWPMGFLAPLPICVVGWLAEGATGRRWRTALGVSLGSLPLWIIHHAWVADVSLAGVAPLVIYLSIWPGLAAALLSYARRASGLMGPALALPTVWVGLEFMRGELVFGGYAWFLAGQPMIELLPLARASSVGGVYMVSWMVVAVSGVAVAARFGGRAQRRVGWGVSAGVVAALVAGLVIQPGGASGRQAVVAAVQTDVPQDNKLLPTPEQINADFNDLVNLIREAGGRDVGGVSPALIVVPETVFPGVALDAAGVAVAAAFFGDEINGFRDELVAAQQDAGAALLVGSLTRDGLRTETTDAGERLAWDAAYNSAYLLTGGDVVAQRYDKLRPTPFGETLPYVQNLPWLRDLIIRIGLGASGMDFGLAWGERPVVFSVPAADGAIGVASPICFESSMSRVVRALVARGEAAGRPVELLAVMTNDGWFGAFDPGRAMHLLQGRWRCVESALPMVRSANTGVTAAIDRDGRIIESLPVRRAGTLVASVALGGGSTVYMVIGDAVGWACVVGGLAWTVLGIRGCRRDRRLGAGAAVGRGGTPEGNTEDGQDGQRA